MFREFIYLDIDRIQSIISQLQEGLLKEIMKGNAKEASASAKTGFLSHILSINISGKKSEDIKQNKILHDYSYNMALESLKEHKLLLEGNDLYSQKSLPIEAAFVLIKGNAKIIDYQTVKHLAENEKRIEKMFKASSLNRQQRRKQNTKNENKNNLGEMKDFVEIFIGDSIQVSIHNKNDINFMGILDRVHLREDIRSLIHKYGSKPQGEWTMLAQISRIPEQNTLLEQVEGFSDLFKDFSTDNINAVSDFFNIFIEFFNDLQEMMSSVTYPNISVTPIALYRELHPFK